MTDERIQRLAAGAVLLVAAIAAVVSYIHVESIAATHGQGWAASLLLPLSVDGTVAAASLQMLRSARHGRPVDWLQRLMLAAGVAATLAANVLYGWPHGIVSAVISGWPAAAFIGSAEMAIRSIRQGRPEQRKKASRPARKPAGKRAKVTAKVAAIVTANPAIDGPQLAARMGVSERTARRYLEQHHGRAAA